MMRFNNVCLEAVGYTLPEEVVTTAQLEQQLQPVYDRLRLPQGRLELITGVSERRFWARGTLPSQQSIRSAEAALAAADVDRAQVGALIHGSVCRDHLEPATACAVHHGLRLPTDCLIFDLSNACLGLLNGTLQLATMIDAGQIQAGIVVGTESSRQLVETTVQELNQRTSLTRKQIKTAIASLTIGSGSCAMLLVHQDLSKTGNRLLGGTAKAYKTIEVDKGYVRNVLFTLTVQGGSPAFEFRVVLSNEDLVDVIPDVAVLLFNELGVQVGNAVINPDTLVDTADGPFRLKSGDVRSFSGEIELVESAEPKYYVVKVD